MGTGHTTTTAVERAGGQQRSLCRRARETPRVALVARTSAARLGTHGVRSSVTRFGASSFARLRVFSGALLPARKSRQDCRNTIPVWTSPHSPSRIMLGKTIYDDRNDDRLISE